LSRLKTSEAHPGILLREVRGVADRCQWRSLDRQTPGQTALTSVWIKAGSAWSRSELSSTKPWRADC